jgi:hypothetical protein
MLNYGNVLALIFFTPEARGMQRAFIFHLPIYFLPQAGCSPWDLCGEIYNLISELVSERCNYAPAIFLAKHHRLYLGF